MRDLERSEDDWDDKFADKIVALWRNFTNRRLSEVQDIQSRGLASILDNILAKPTKADSAGGVDAEVAYNRVSAFLQRQRKVSPALGSLRAFKRRYDGDPRMRKVVNEINTVEEKIERASASRQQMELLIKKMFSGPKRMDFSDREIQVFANDGETIGLSLLSGGEKQVLEIFLQTLLSEISTLLIDEPELSLHVDWQRGLIPAMRLLNPQCQLIVVTHSPDIMADIPDENIYHL